MELETLKSLWQEQDLPPGRDTDPEDLLAILQKRSRGPIARMRRNLRFEGLLMVISYIPIIVAYLGMFDGKLSLISLIMSIVLVFYGVYYYRKNQLLKNMQCVTCEVRSNLARQTKTLEKYLRFYTWSGTLVPVVSIVLAFQTLRYSYRHLSFRPSFYWWMEPSYFLLLVIPFAIGLHFLNKRLVNKLYGRHVEKLKDLLREMDEG